LTTHRQTQKTYCKRWTSILY